MTVLRRILPGLLCGLLLLISFEIAMADPRPLIWEASRTGTNSVRLRTGVQWPSRFAPGFGVVTAVNADDKGAIGSVPVAFWGSLVLGSQASQAALSSQKVNLNLNAETRETAVRFTDSQGWIASPAVNVVSDRSVTVKVRPGARSAFKALQALRLEFPQLGASIAASGTVYAHDGSDGFTKSLSLQKSLFSTIKFTASLSEDASAPTAGFKLAYNAKW
jgi:hypothetical protein